MVLKKSKKVFLLFLIINITPLFLFSQSFTVMTYNIRYDNPDDGINSWSNRKSLICKQLNSYIPDILGIQEGLFHQVEFLDGVLENHGYVGTGRKDGKRESEFCAIFYDTIKFSLIEHNTFWLSETPDTPSIGWNAMLERICTYALIQQKNSGKKLWVFNTHFDHVGFVARQESAKLIHSKIENINIQNYPVIIMGDLNAEPNSKPIQFLSNLYFDSKLANKSLTYCPEGTFNGFSIKEPVTRRIDYIFTTKLNIMIRKYAVVNKSYNGKFVSDHFPVIVEIEFKK